MDSVLATIAEIEKRGYRFGNLYLRNDERYRVNFLKLRSKDKFLYGEGDCISSCLDHALTTANGNKEKPQIKKAIMQEIW